MAYMMRQRITSKDVWSFSRDKKATKIDIRERKSRIYKKILTGIGENNGIIVV